MPFGTGRRFPLRQLGGEWKHPVFCSVLQRFAGYLGVPAKELCWSGVGTETRCQRDSAALSTREPSEDLRVRAQGTAPCSQPTPTRWGGRRKASVPDLNTKTPSDFQWPHLGSSIKEKNQAAEQAAARAAGKPQSLFKRVLNGALLEAALGCPPGLGPKRCLLPPAPCLPTASRPPRSRAASLGTRPPPQAPGRGSHREPGSRGGRKSEFLFNSQQTGGFPAGKKQALLGRRGCSCPVPLCPRAPPHPGLGWS